MLGSVSLVVFLLCTFLYKLIRGQAIKKDGAFIKIIKFIPLELWLITIFIASIKSISFLTIYNGVVEKILGFIGIFIVVIICYLQLYILKSHHYEVDFLKNTIIYKVYKFMKNSSVSILRSSKRIPLIRRILLVAFIIIMFSFIVGYIIAKIFFGMIGIGMIILMIPVLLAIIIYTVYIVKKLNYLSKIIEGTEKIKNGDLNYKIEINGYDSFAELAQNINNIGDGLEKSIDKQLKSERLRSELITNVSHDLKTPLTSIINYIELIKKEENIEPQYIKDYIKVLDTKSKRLNTLIEDLFEASKASSGNIVLNMENLDIIQLLRQSIGELEEKIEDSNLMLKFNVPEEKLYIYADGRRMYRVFENLISNIAKYSLPNTRVYIEVLEENENIRIIMKNISAYELNFNPREITERFKRGDEARNTEGSGLGLAIAKDLVKLQNGKFEIDIDGDLFKAILEFKKSNKPS